MKVSTWFERKTVYRSLLVGVVVLVVLLPYKILVVPHFPALDGLLPDALAAAVTAVVASRIVLRAPGR